MFNPTYFPRQRWAYPKEHERNFVASFFHMISVSLMSISLINMVWFRIYGGSQCASQIRLSQFFTLDSFVISDSSKTSEPGFVDSVHSSIPENSYYYTSNTVLKCVTPEVVKLIRMIILLCIAAIFCSIVGFCLDVIGPKKKLLRIIRQNGLPSIITVLLIVTTSGVSYLVATALQNAAYKAHQKDPASIQVAFDIGYYTITIAGAVSILATACNLLQSSSPPEEIQRHRLIEDYDGVETFSVGMRHIPEPPPPYTP